MIRTGLLNPADGPQTISIGRYTNLPWHEIAVSFFDANGVPLESVASGTLNLASTVIGADQPVMHNQQLDIAVGHRRWRPFFSLIQSVTIIPDNLPTDARYRVTILNVSSPAANSMVAAITDPIVPDTEQRFITELLSNLQSFGQFTDVVSIAANEDFDISFKTSLTNLASAQRPLGGTSEEIRIDPPNNRTRFVTASQFSTWSNTFTLLNASALLEYRFVRTGGTTIELFINGMSFGTQSNSHAVNYQYLGRHNNSYYDGLITDLQITVGSTLVVDTPLDEGPETPYFANRAATLGSNLWSSPYSQPDFLFANTTLDISAEGVTTLTTTDGSSNAFATYNGFVSDGSKYLVTVTIDTTACSTGAFVGVGNLSSVEDERITVGPGVVETVTKILKPTDSANLVFRFNGATVAGDTAVYSNLSIQEIPAATPYITKENIADTQTPLYDQVVATDTLAGGWLRNDNQWTGPVPFVAPATPQFGTALFINNLPIDGTYRIETTVSGAPVGMDLRWSQPGITVFNLTSDGVTVRDGTPTNAIMEFIEDAASNGSEGASIDISYKRFLEVAQS